MNIKLEFNSLEELESFINKFNKEATPEAPKTTMPIKTPLTETAHELIPKHLLRERKLSAKGLKFRQQIKRAILYSKKHKIKFSKAIQKLYKRYASNRDYQIAEQLGYNDPRKEKPTHYDEITAKKDFLSKRTRILTEIGWEHDEAEKAATEAWELGERDPDNFTKTKPEPRRQEQ